MHRRDGEDGADDDRHGERDEHAPVTRPGERPVGEVLRQPTQDEDEDDEADRLDEDLGQREVDRAVEEEEHRRTEPGDPREQDGTQPTA